MAPEAVPIDEAAAAPQPLPADPPTTAARTMPRRLVTVTLDGDWEGWSFTFSRNITLDEVQAFQSVRDIDTTAAFLAKHIETWNFVDEQGTPLPISAETLKGACPNDLTVQVIQKFGEALTLPKT